MLMRVMRSVPRLERLELRDCPAVTVSLVSGNLFIRGVPNGDLTLTATADNQIKVQDATKVLGIFNVPGTLSVQLSSRPGAINLDLVGKTLQGNVLFDLGNGYTGTGLDPEDRAVNIFDSTATTALGAGTIRGNVNIQRGDGNELVGVGFIQSTVGVDRPITVRGNLTVVGRASLTFTENLQLGEGSEVRGAVGVTHYDNVTLGSQVNTITNVTRVLGDVSVTTASVGGGLAVNLSGNFLRNVTVNGAAPSATFNSFTLTPPDVNVSSQISGNLSVTFASSINGNLFSILDDVPGTGVSRILGTTTLTSNNGSIGADDAFLNGEFAGNVTVSLGDGENFFTVAPESTFNASLTYNATNGDNTLQIEGLITNRLNINVGNGTNTADITAQVNNRIVLRAGSGTNTVTLNAPNNVYALDFLFGNGTNTVNLTAGDVISGLLIGGTGTNTLNQNGATILALSKINF
jgi:hypothetical protein